MRHLLRLVFGNYRLCDGCSNGRHTNHTPVACMCDICAPEDPR